MYLSVEEEAYTFNKISEHSQLIMGKKRQMHVLKTCDCIPVAEVGGLPHCSHQPVNKVSLPLVVNAHGLLHRHGDHLLK